MFVELYTEKIKTNVKKIFKNIVNVFFNNIYIYIYELVYLTNLNASWTADKNIAWL